MRAQREKKSGGELATDGVGMISSDGGGIVTFHLRWGGRNARCPALPPHLTPSVNSLALWLHSSIYSTMSVITLSIFREVSLNFLALRQRGHNSLLILVRKGLCPKEWYSTSSVNSSSSSLLTARRKMIMKAWLVSCFRVGGELLRGFGILRSFSLSEKEKTKINTLSIQKIACQVIGTEDNFSYHG